LERHEYLFIRRREIPMKWFAICVLVALLIGLEPWCEEVQAMYVLSPAANGTVMEKEGGASTLNPVDKSNLAGAVTIIKNPPFAKGPTANLTAMVSVSGLAPRSRHAEDIHMGVCGGNGPVAFPLVDIIADARGRAIATTEINVHAIPASGWSIELHRNNASSATIACGNVHDADRIQMFRLPPRGDGVVLITTDLDRAGMKKSILPKGTEIIVSAVGLPGDTVLTEDLREDRCNGPVKYALSNLIADARGESVAATYVSTVVSTSILDRLYLAVHTRDAHAGLVACVEIVNGLAGA
jgi:hypothetical protein